MTILDTNVISEAMKETPDQRVFRWLDSRPPLSLFATAISEAEVRYGLLSLPEGRRREELLLRAETLFTRTFQRRILPFGREAAAFYASLRADRRKLGRPMSPFDAQIAAIAASTGATLATRNIRDFTDCGLDLVNPWD